MRATAVNRKPRRAPAPREDYSTDPNWQVECINCGAVPTIGDSGLCGPCCYGEAETIGDGE